MTKKLSPQDLAGEVQIQNKTLMIGTKIYKGTIPILRQQRDWAPTYLQTPLRLPEFPHWPMGFTLYQSLNQCCPLEQKLCTE